MCRCTLGNTAMPTSGPLWLLRSRPMSLIMHTGLTSPCSSKLVKVDRISSFCLLGSTLVSVLVGFFRSFYLHVPATVAESSCEWLPALPFWFGSLSDVFIPYFISPHHPKYSTVFWYLRWSCSIFLHHITMLRGPKLLTILSWSLYQFICSFIYCWVSNMPSAFPILALISFSSSVISLSNRTHPRYQFVSLCLRLPVVVQHHKNDDQCTVAHSMPCSQGLCW